jgi:hypothetical protein
MFPLLKNSALIIGEGRADICGRVTRFLASATSEMEVGRCAAELRIEGQWSGRLSLHACGKNSGAKLL